MILGLTECALLLPNSFRIAGREGLRTIEKQKEQ